MKLPQQAQLFPLDKTPQPLRADAVQRYSAGRRSQDQAAQLKPVSGQRLVHCSSILRPPLWLCIELPWLALQAAFGPSGMAGPAAIYERRGGRDHVVMASRLARRHGVTPDMSLSQAYALSPQLQALPREQDKEQMVIWRVAELAYEISALVNVLNESTVLLELGRSLRWLGGQRLQRQLRRRLDQAGYVSRIGVAPSMNAARLLATTQQQALDHHQSIALLRSRSINELPIDARRRQAMQACGLKQIGDLLRLPAGSVQRRFGKQVAAFLLSLSGDNHSDRSTLLKPYRPALQFEQSLELPAPAVSNDLVEQAAERLLVELHQFLLHHDKALTACTLMIELDIDDQTERITTVELGLRRASSELSYLRLVLNEKLERLRLLAPAVRVSLHSDQLVDYPAEQSGLFDSGLNARGDASQWLDHLTARLGANCLSSLSPVADHRPELSYRHMPPGRGMIDQHDSRSRPLWLLPKAQPLSTVSNLTILFGPERIESGWWDGRDCRREYFVARDQRGRGLWIYRDGKGQKPQWFLQGLWG